MQRCNEHDFFNSMNDISKYAKEKMQRCYDVNEHDFFKSMNERSNYTKRKCNDVMNMISSTR
jgi:hypothetical protein